MAITRSTEGGLDRTVRSVPPHFLRRFGLAQCCPDLPRIVGDDAADVSAFSALRSRDRPDRHPALRLRRPDGRHQRGR
jgi:hypothetical protein